MAVPVSLRRLLVKTKSAPLLTRLLELVRLQRMQRVDACVHVVGLQRDEDFQAAMEAQHGEARSKALSSCANNTT